MDNIEKVRAKISMYDDEIIKILSKRMDCIDEIMQYKKKKVCLYYNQNMKVKKK